MTPVIFIIIVDRHLITHSLYPILGVRKKQGKKKTITQLYIQTLSIFFFRYIHIFFKYTTMPVDENEVKKGLFVYESHVFSDCLYNK